MADEKSTKADVKVPDLVVVPPACERCKKLEAELAEYVKKLAIADGKLADHAKKLTDAHAIVRKYVPALACKDLGVPAK